MDSILLVFGFTCVVVFALTLHGLLNFISPNFGKFGYALPLTEVQCLYGYHVVLVRWRVTCCSGMHWRIHCSEFWKVKVGCASVGRFANCPDEKSVKLFVTKQKRICSRCVGVEVKNMSPGKIAGE